MLKEWKELFDDICQRKRLIHAKDGAAAIKAAGYELNAVGANWHSPIYGRSLLNLICVGAKSQPFAPSKDFQETSK